MKKIAIITASYGGSSIALAKALTDKGYIVDYIKITQWRKKIEIQACDCSYTSKHLGFNRIDRTHWSSLSCYFSNDNFNLYSLTVPRQYKTIPVLRLVLRLVRELIIYRATKLLNKQKYDAVNVIGRYDANELVPIIETLDSRVFLTLHETSNQKNNVNVYEETPLMKNAFDKKLDILVHSDTSHKDLLKYARVIPEKVHNIPFGSFDSYSYVSEAPVPNLPNDYLLYFGYIQPYKGLSILYDAVDSNPDLYGNKKVLVVGIGNDPILDKIKKNDHFVCINRFVTDNELVTIIKKSYAIICPYLKMSQSGVPQTAIVFHKPLITSDLPSFRDVIEDGVDGLIFKTGDILSLNEKVKLILNKEVYERMIVNIMNHQNLHQKISWDRITNEYVLNKLIQA